GQCAGDVSDQHQCLFDPHRLGMIHRDLKPANILIDDRGVPWIADFGLAVRNDELQSRKGEIAGTPTYMAPEQVIGDVQRMDARSDIWATGIMLFESIAGRPPFRGKSIEQLVKIIRESDLPSLSQMKRFDQEQGKRFSIPELESVIRRCVAKESDGRFASIEELSQSLDDLLLRSGFDTAGNLVQRDADIGEDDTLPAHVDSTYETAPAARHNSRTGPTTIAAISLVICALMALIVGGVLYSRGTWSPLIGNNLAQSRPIVAPVENDGMVDPTDAGEITSGGSNAENAPALTAAESGSLADSNVVDDGDTMSDTDATETVDTTPPDPHADGRLLVRVDGDGEFPDLQSAVDAARPDDEIVLGGLGTI
ncbi:MAG: protein kinase, partial [Planctomycetota bacterium]